MRKLLLLLSLAFALHNISLAQISIVGQTCEMLSNPIGIDATTPRLAWKIEAGQLRGVKQEAYEILVASSMENLKAGRVDLWSSGKIDSDQSIMVEYAGTPLSSKMECYWQVKVWTNKGESDWSQISSWTMGLLAYNDWQGRWIGFDRLFSWDNDSMHARLSARYLRKDFSTNKLVEKAYAYIIGLGNYELSINGSKIGNAVLAPTPTDYNKNVKYNVYEVTDALAKGQNTLGVVLGNGLYYTMRQHYKSYKIKNFGFPKLLMQLEITYEDGSKEVIKTDDSWKGNADGPIRSNNIYDGEEYDARKEMTGWNRPGFDDSDWLVPEYVEEPPGKFEAQMNAQMKVLKSIKPVSIKKLSDDRYIMDMGQNMVGWIKMSVSGEAGNEVKLRFAEILDEYGSLAMANLRDAKVTDIYTLKGDGVETWEPKFVYHGFRYVEITGYPGEPKLEYFVGQVVSDEMSVAGSFETSDALINQIYQNAYWGILGNYKGMPLDCPQRNERMPWLGDRTIGAVGESFVFDNQNLYSKWVDDIQYSQKWDGAISDVAPAFWRYYSDNMTWSGTFLTIADMLYRQFGDERPTQKHYADMKKWLWYMKDRYMTDDYILTKDSYGDWCKPKRTIEEGRGKSGDIKSPSPLISTAYFYYYLQLMSDFAKVSGNEEDIETYQSLRQHVRDGFNLQFLNRDIHTYRDTNELTDCLLALRFGLVPDEEKEELIMTIRRIIEEDNNGHLSTGLVGTQWLMRTLSENGMEDLSYQLATNKSYPSWGYMVENGATTIWELWNGNTAAPDMNSYNHVMMLGDLIIWYYQNLAGIKAVEPGFKKLEMKPETTSPLRFVNATYMTPYGNVKSHWIEGKKSTFEWKITIPENTSAIVYIPATSQDVIKESNRKLSQQNDISFVRMEGGYAVVEIGSGQYQFQSKF